MKPTPTQKKYLRAISRHIAKHGWAPSIRQICEELGVNSTNGVSEMLEKLQARGFLIRAAGQSRAMRLTQAGMEASHG